MIVRKTLVMLNKKMRHKYILCDSIHIKCKYNYSDRSQNSGALSDNDQKM